MASMATTSVMSRWRKALNPLQLRVHLRRLLLLLLLSPRLPAEAEAAASAAAAGVPEVVEDSGGLLREPMQKGRLDLVFDALDLEYLEWWVQPVVEDAGPIGIRTSIQKLS